MKLRKVLFILRDPFVLKNGLTLGVPSTVLLILNFKHLCTFLFS